jgi:uncharacterized protein (DUF1786 family)
MALFSSTSFKAFDEVGGVKKHIKLGDKIYTGDDQARTIRDILNKYQIYAAQRTIDVAGKNVHEFTISLQPTEQVMPEKQIGYLLQPHYEIDLAS